MTNFYRLSFNTVSDTIRCDAIGEFNMDREADGVVSLI